MRDRVWKPSLICLEKRKKKKKKVIEYQQQSLTLCQTSDAIGPSFVTNHEIYHSKPAIFTARRFELNWFDCYCVFIKVLLCVYQGVTVFIKVLLCVYQGVTVCLSRCYCVFIKGHSLFNKNSLTQN